MSALLLALCLQQPDIELELGVRAMWTAPKFRVRDGRKYLKGTSIFSKELDAESAVGHVGISFRSLDEDDRFTLDVWEFTAEGEGTLDDPKDFGGQTIPTGTLVESETRIRHCELEWLHRFKLPPHPDGHLLWMDAGAALQYVLFDADLGFDSERLEGLYPAPRLTIGYGYGGWLWLEAGAGGFFIPFRNGDTSILDPIEYRLAVGGRLGHFSLELAYDLYHVHLEEHAGRTEEDVVHLRLRSLSLALSVRF